MTPSSPLSRRPFDLFEWLANHEGIVDAALASVTAIGLLILALIEPGAWVRWTLAMVVCTAFLRTHTECASAALGIVALAHFACGPILVVGDAFLFYALYLCVVRARRFPRRLALGAALVGALLMTVSVTLQMSMRFGTDYITAITMGIAIYVSCIVALMALWALGRYKRVKITQLNMAEERAAQAEREREQLAQLAVAAERSRIAREMHDVIAHSLSVIIAQADGGRYVASGAPAKAEEVFSTISSTGRTALTDMRSLLGVLRDDSEQGRSPQAGLAQLPAVIDSFRSSGLTIIAPEHLPAPPQSAIIDLTILRLIQEALTNALKHAGPSSTVTVALTHESNCWTVRVENTAPTAPPRSEPIPSAGQGLRGMQERVRVAGGTLEAGPRVDGGFLIVASFPDAKSSSKGMS